LLNRTGEEITGYRFVAFGNVAAGALADFLASGRCDGGQQTAAEAGSGFLTPGGQKRSWNIGSPCGRRTSTTGYVFISRFNRLEAPRTGSCHKDRMAALDVSRRNRTKSAAVNAMAGAVKELARCSLQEDEQHLVGS